MLQHIAHLLLTQKEIAPCNVSYSFSNLCFVVSCIAVFICVEIVNARSAVSLLTSDSPDKFPTGRDKLGRTTGKYTTPLNQTTHATNLRQSAQHVCFQTLRFRIAAKVLS